MEPLSSHPDSVLYGRQTKLGILNFGPGRRRLGDVPALVRNYAAVKSAAARANRELGVIDESIARAIIAATDEISTGLHDREFPTALVLGGGGTTTNMNVNEVIAARASQIAGMAVHPNDHVNASQSTNDTYPTAMALTVLELAAHPLAALDDLIDAFDSKAAEYDDTVRLGRTCLQDAVTLTVGQTHRSHATALRRTAAGLRSAVDELTSVPLGATVLGTGIGAPDGYRERAVTGLASLTGLPLTSSDDLFDALAHLDPYAAIASAGVRVSLTMAKIAADLRLLSSGPGGGFAEVRLPAVQAGSSIMAGKINPAIPEYVMQLSYRIRGAGHTIEAAAAAGELELNVMEPIIMDALIDILDDIASSATVFAERCIRELTWDGARRASNADAGFDKWVTLAAEQGYDIAADQVRSTWAADRAEVAR
ncbi:MULTISPECIES: lyase family protein [unclassified Microbacterium]|uniref:lyase family protein n=1 Tax=unclassified Microbacterium TaxID=2609290 RepID=UPI001604DA02|nr:MULTISPECIES: lyase family protein [unclassified Microbacterium]QNA91956.1 aspartate ammonia-lyase [Microbacterium sp. Se63.02b]QYM65185.1 aspartate ammonia-lyase [Microbacterium sp. Se5.02b]